MKRNFLYLVAAIATVMTFGSCETDYSIVTTELSGKWFVNRIETISSKTLDNEDYYVINSKEYDAYSHKEGNMLFVVKETSNYNEFFVTEYKYDGTKWINQKQETVKLSSNNKFIFNDRQCKFKSATAELLEIKAKYGNEIYRYRLEKTLITP